jgi:hypothetical protein
MDDARETRIERLRAAVEAAVAAGHYSEAIRIASEAELAVEITPVADVSGLERVRIFFEAPVVFERETPEWVPPAFVGMLPAGPTDLSVKAKDLARGRRETPAA